MQNLPEIIIIGLNLQGRFGRKSHILAEKFGSQNTGSQKGNYFFHLWSRVLKDGILGSRIPDIFWGKSGHFLLITIIWLKISKKLIVSLSKLTLFDVL